MIADLVQAVRRGLGVDASYDATVIPHLISRSINRLLRDYHFPKSVTRTEYPNLSAGQQEFVLPAGFKKDLLVHFHDPVARTWSSGLNKREGFQLPSAQGVAYSYWLQGLNLVLDTPVTQDMSNLSLVLYHESMDVPSNEAWMTDDFPTAIEYASIVRGAAEMRKPEVMQTYAPLCADERESLAIYLNELEWSGVEMYQREARYTVRERYPA